MTEVMLAQRSKTKIYIAEESEENVNCGSEAKREQHRIIRMCAEIASWEKLDSTFFFRYESSS